MSYTDSTANLKLPQWQENDYPSWLNDVNSAFRSIDQKAGEQDSSIQQALSEVSDARTLATKASNDVTSLSGEVNSVKNDVSEVRELASAASTTANSAMDVAEIAQDTAEEVAGRTANIITDQAGIKHTVNNVVSGFCDYATSGFTIVHRGGDNHSGLLLSDDGSFITVNKNEEGNFNSANVLSRLAALESVSISTINAINVEGTVTITVQGNVCFISARNINTSNLNTWVEIANNLPTAKTNITGVIQNSDSPVGVGGIYFQNINTSSLYVQLTIQSINNYIYYSYPI